MKKTLFLTLLLLGSFLILSSCFSAPRSFRLNLADASSDYSATVVFAGKAKEEIFVLRKWNGTNLKFRLYGRSGIYFAKPELTVPAGETDFVFDMLFYVGNVQLKAGNSEITYRLEPGKTYIVKGRLHNPPGPVSAGEGSALIQTLMKMRESDTEYYVGIYDSSNENELLKEWQIWRKL